MNEQFTHIATVLFQHTYFEQGLFTTLESHLAQESRTVLRNLGLLLKPFAGGIHILSSDLTLLKSSSANTPLRITLECNDTYYINYTQLPNFQPASECICIHNLGTTQIESGTFHRLQKETYVGSNEIMKVHNTTITLKSFDPAASYTFTNASGTPLLETYIKQPDPSINRFLMNDIPEGIIHVKENNVQRENLYYQPKDLWKKPLGILELYPAALYDHYFENEDTVTYKLDFEARKTFWKYIFVQQGANSFEQLTIIDSARNEVFDRSSDNDTIIFTSKIPHLLSNTSIFSFQLVNNFIPGERKESIVVKHLPHPSPNQLHFNEDPTDTSEYSHIYVYI